MPFKKGMGSAIKMHDLAAVGKPSARSPWILHVPGSCTSLPRLLDPDRDHLGVSTGRTRPNAEGQKHTREKYEVTWQTLSMRDFKSEKRPNPLAKKSKFPKGLGEMRSQSCRPSASCTHWGEKSWGIRKTCQNKQIVIWKNLKKKRLR